jgi:hypothetical protein
MGIWIRQGTASCENGSTSVTGTLTLFKVAKAGDGFRFIGDNVVYEIADDPSENETLTLINAYEGTTKSDAAFEIIPYSPRRQDTPRLYQRVDLLLSQISTLVTTTGKPADSYGADGTLAIDKSARLMYLKTDGAWDSGTSLGGPGYGGESTDEATIGTGEQVTFGIPSGFAYVAGSRVRAIAVGSSPLAWMEGPLDEYDGGTLSLTPDKSQGAGTFSDWLFTIVGEPGHDAWTPVLAIESDGERRVQKVSDWTGGSDAKPATGKYVGSDGFVDTKAEAADIRGDAGDDGDDGWSPVFATVTDGDRRVLKVSDWQGGTGTKPSTGKYVGASGLVDAVEDAVDIRGPIGETGPASLVSKPSYDPETTYQANDVVEFDGSSWVALQETTGNTPPELGAGSPANEDEYWRLLAAKGDKGDTGDPGAPGLDGDDGTNFSPNAQGSFSDRSNYDGEDPGFVYLSLDGDGDGGTSAVLFFKEEGSPAVWSDPVAFQGPVGPVGVLWRGDYADDILYNQNDGVLNQGGSWRAKQETSGNAPPTLPTTENDYWKLVAAPGNVQSVNGKTDASVVIDAADIEVTRTPDNYTPAGSPVGTSVEDHLAGIDERLPNGEVVGTSDAQTLTNKTASLDDNTFNYTPAPTGGVSRKVAGKLDEFISVKDFGAKGDGVQLLDGAITASDTTLTSSTASFTADDVGKVVLVFGAGSLGFSDILRTTIASVTDANTVELTDAADNTVSGVEVIYGTDDATALNAAAAIGRPIYFPVGTYLTSEEIVLNKRGTKFFGAASACYESGLNPASGGRTFLSIIQWVGDLDTYTTVIRASKEAVGVAPRATAFEGADLVAMGFRDILIDGSDLAYFGFYGTRIGTPNNEYCNFTAMRSVRTNVWITQAWLCNFYNISGIFGLGEGIALGRDDFSWASTDKTARVSGVFSNFCAVANGRAKEFDESTAPNKGYGIGLYDNKALLLKPDCENNDGVGFYHKPMDGPSTIISLYCERNTQDAVAESRATHHWGYWYSGPSNAGGHRLMDPWFAISNDGTGETEYIRLAGSAPDGGIGNDIKIEGGLYGGISADWQNYRPVDAPDDVLTNIIGTPPRQCGGRIGFGFVPQVLRVAVTLDFGSIAAGGSLDSSDISVPGAKFGDVVLVGNNIPNGGISMTGFVNTANAIKIRVINHNTVAFDPGNRTYRIMVLQDPALDITA